MLKKTTRKFNYKSKLCQNATLKCSTVVKLNAFEHSINWMLDALSGRKQLRHDLGGQCLSEVARFIGNPLDIWPWWHDLSPSNFLTHLGLVSHICVLKNSSHFPSDAYMRHKSLYFSYRLRGRPTKQCQAKMTRSMIVVLIPVYDITTSSQSRHSSAPNWHALYYWLAYTMTDTYLLMVL